MNAEFLHDLDQAIERLELQRTVTLAEIEEIQAHKKALEDEVSDLTTARNLVPHKCSANTHGRHRFGAGSFCKDCRRDFFEIHAVKLRAAYEKQKQMPVGAALCELIERGCVKLRDLLPDEPYSDSSRWLIANREWVCMNCREVIKKGQPLSRYDLICEDGRIISHWCTRCAQS